MAANINNEKLIAQYLLGDLPEEQQVEIEDRAFQDKEYLAAITAVENDLIDEYVRQELSETERRKFEAKFLASAERRKRVDFAKAFVKVAAESSAVEKTKIKPSRVSWRDSFEAFIRGLNPAARLAFAVAVLLIMLGGAWLMTETLRLRGQLTQLQAKNQTERQSLQQQVETERRRSEELAARLNQEKQQREQSEESLRQLSETAETTNSTPRPIVATFTLLPGLARGEDKKPKLLLPKDARLVRLQIGIDPEEPYKTFSAELRTVAGRQIWTRDNLTASARRGARAIGLTLPATVLKPGDYELKVSGVAQGGRTEDVGFYYFAVIRRHD
jgi:anti-sigma factor RsiW